MKGSGLRRATIEQRILWAARCLGDADEQARELYRPNRPDDVETRKAQTDRREPRNTIARLGRLLEKRVVAEERKRQEDEHRDEREAWAGL